MERDEQDQDQQEQGEQHPSPTERLEDVGTSRGTYDLPEPGEAQRESGTAGLPEEDEVPEETLEEIHSDRSERLDADNRPDGAEVDNTPRTFDAGAGMFTDSPDYDPDARPYAEEDDAGPPEDGGDSGSDAGPVEERPDETSRADEGRSGEDDQPVSEDER